MAASANTLGTLVLELTRGQQRPEVDENTRRNFYKEFASEVGAEVERARERKQRSYESIKDIALR